MPLDSDPEAIAPHHLPIFSQKYQQYIMLKLDRMLTVKPEHQLVEL